jgi:hypothetical protein
LTVTPLAAKSSLNSSATIASLPNFDAWTYSMTAGSLLRHRNTRPGGFGVPHLRQ